MKWLKFVLPVILVPFFLTVRAEAADADELAGEFESVIPPESGVDFDIVNQKIGAFCNRVL